MPLRGMFCVASALLVACGSSDQQRKSAPLLSPLHERETSAAQWRASDEYLEAHRRELQIQPGELQRSYTLPTINGFVACYRQLHRAVPILNGGLCLDFVGDTVAVNDQRIRNVRVSTRPRISADEVKQLVTSRTGWSIQREPELHVLPPGVFGVASYRLAWRVQRWMGGRTNALWIDADNGTTLHDEPPSIE